MQKKFYRNLGKKLVLFALVAVMLIGMVAAAGVSINGSQVSLSGLHANTTNVIVAGYNTNGQMLFAKVQPASQTSVTVDLTQTAFLRVFETNNAYQPTREVTTINLLSNEIQTTQQLLSALQNGGTYYLTAMDEFAITSAVTVANDVTFLLGEGISLASLDEDIGIQDPENALITFSNTLTIASGKKLTIGEGVEIHAKAVVNNGEIVVNGVFNFDQSQYSGNGKCTGVNDNMLQSISLSDGYSIAYNKAQTNYTVRIPAGRPRVPDVSAVALPGAQVTVTQAVIPDSADRGSAYVSVTDGEQTSEYKITFVKDEQQGFQLQYDDYFVWSKQAASLESSNPGVVKIEAGNKLHAVSRSNSPVTITAKDASGNVLRTLTVDKVIKAPINICMIIGQSNAYGFLDVPAGYATFDEFANVQKALCDAPAPGTVWCDDISTGYDDYWFSGRYDLSQKRVGFSPALGKYWYNLTGEKSMMVQTAIGSTPIEAWTKDPSLKFFGIDCYGENLERFNYYKNEFTKADSNFELDHVYAFWAQGESCQEFYYSSDTFKWDYKNNTPNYYYVGDWIGIDAQHPRMTAQQYNGYFTSMINSLKADTGVEFVGIIPVRSMTSVSSAANIESQQLTDLVNSRVAQYTLNNMGSDDFGFVTRVSEIARMESYPDQDAEGWGFIGCANIHFNQRGYNAIGKDAAMNTVERLYKKPVQATELKVLDTDGKTELEDGSAIYMEYGDKHQIAAIALPLYASDTALTFTSSNPAAFTVDQYGLITAIGSEGATSVLTVSNGNLTTEITLCIPKYTTLNTVTKINNAARFLGRTYSDGSVHWFDWTLSGFEVSFEGIGLTARLRTNLGWGGASLANNTSVAVFVDGETEPSRKIELNQTDAEYVLASGLSDGKHTVKVLKMHDVGYASAGVQELSVVNGTFLNKPVSTADHKIEFIGDSLTTGDGLYTYNKNINGGYISINQDATKSHTKLIADAFNADVNVISWCGRGVVWNNEGRDQSQGGEPMTLVYPLTDYYYNKTQQWNFSQFEPELIVLNLGTNDYGSIIQSEANKTRFVNTYVSFLQTIRSKNPNAKILCTCGTTFSETGCPGFTATMTALFDRISAAAAQAGLSNVVFYTMPDDFEPSDGYGNDIHASPASQAKTANYLIEEIESIMGWTTVD